MALDFLITVIVGSVTVLIHKRATKLDKFQDS